MKLNYEIIYFIKNEVIKYKKHLDTRGCKNKIIKYQNHIFIILIVNGLIMVYLKMHLLIF